MKRVDMTNVQEPTGFDRPEAGAYICKITAVEDLPAKEYLKVTYDIAEGKYAGYYTKTREEHPDWAWAGAYSKSYKTSALSFFKRFCTAISRSNGNFVFDGGAVNADERTLVGKKIGLLFQEEEYYGNDGEKKTRLIVNREFSVDKLSSQKTPKPKLLQEESVAGGVDGFMSIPDGMDEEMPFA